MLSQFDKLFMNVISKGYYGSFNIDFKMNPSLFNYIYDHHMMDKFTYHSISLYAPIECLYKIGNKIQWDVVISRDDLDAEFIKKNINNFNIQEMNYKCFLPYDYMVQNIKNNTFSSFDRMLYKLLQYGKYTFNEFMTLLKLISNKLKNNNRDVLNYEDDFKELYKKYIILYYKDNLPINVVNLKNFMTFIFDIFKNNYTYFKFNDINNKYYSFYLFEYIKDKITPNDLEYLIQNNIFDYYCGSKEVSNKLFNVFYNYRYHLINKDINPLIMKGYTFEQMEELINYSLQLGVAKKTVWAYISEFVLNLKTPSWFWKKYKKDIYWRYSVENIIDKLDENDSNMMHLFMVWILDNYSIIETEFVLKINRCYIYPDIFIACFAKDNNSNGILNRALKLQKINISVLNYLAENNYINPQNWEDISSYQPINPDFINKYKSKLNWDLIKFNPTWQEFDHKLFNKLPVFDSENKLLWQSCDDKLKTLNAFANGLNTNSPSSGIKVVKDESNPNLLIVDMCLYEELNYLSKSNYNRDKYIYENVTWNIRNHNWDFYTIDSSKYHKIVYNFNTNNMDGRNTTLLGNMNSTYIPMGVGFISHLPYRLGTVKRIKIPFSKLIFSNKKPHSYSSPNYNIPYAIYIPLEYVNETIIS